MSQLFSTVVMKTDLSESTRRLSTLGEEQLRAFLEEHKELVLAIAARHSGTLVKGEGDAFWLLFPSVTAAALAAMTILEELQMEQVRKEGEARVEARIAIALGDVLHLGGDIFGDTVNLTARLEALTPINEIYLSQAAWLAINKAELNTSFVQEAVVKGFSDPIRVYKVDQQYRSRLISNQVIVVTDLNGFTAYAENHPISELEKLFAILSELQNVACRDYGGMVRIFLGDSSLLTFTEPASAFAAVDFMVQGWQAFRARSECPCNLCVAVAKGDMYAFRSHLFGADITNTFRLLRVGKQLGTTGDNVVVAQERVQKELATSDWATRLEATAVPPGMTLPHNESLLYRLA